MYNILASGWTCTHILCIRRHIAHAFMSSWFFLHKNLYKELIDLRRVDRLSDENQIGSGKWGKLLFRCGFTKGIYTFVVVPVILCYCLTPSLLRCWCYGSVKWDESMYEFVCVCVLPSISTIKTFNWMNKLFVVMLILITSSRWIFQSDSLFFHIA